MKEVGGGTQGKKLLQVSRVQVKKNSQIIMVHELSALPRPGGLLKAQC